MDRRHVSMDRVRCVLCWLLMFGFIRWPACLCILCYLAEDEDDIEVGLVPHTDPTHGED